MLKKQKLIYSPWQPTEAGLTVLSISTDVEKEVQTGQVTCPGDQVRDGRARMRTPATGFRPRGLTGTCTSGCQITL